MASRIAVKASSSPGGSVVGFLLPQNQGLGTPQLADLPICALFSRLLLDMAEDLSGGTPERPNTGEGLIAMSTARARFNGVLLPQAARYAEDRAKLVQRYSRASQVRSGGGQPSQGPRPRRASVSPPVPEDAEASRREDGAAEYQHAASTPLGSKALAPESPESASGLSTPRESLAPDEEEALQQLEEWGDAGEDGGEGAAGREEEDKAAKNIYRHTFAVLKGELLSSQLLEPEVMHFIAQFSDLFKTIFDVYADVPITATDGHMSLTAFLRFCNDFALFPGMVDFQTVQWLYNTAEGCSEFAPPAPPASSSHTPTGEDYSPARRGSDGRESVRRESSTSLARGGATTGQSPDASRRGTLLRELSMTMGRKKKPGPSRQQQQQQQQQDDAVLYCGRWLKSQLAWLTKDPGRMSAEERTMVALLWAMDEWLQDVRMQVPEVCSFLAPPGPEPPGGAPLGFEEFRIMVDFMRLEDAPSPADVRCLATALAPQLPPSSQEKLVVDVDSLQMALMVVAKQKERRNRVANCFMKDFSRMTKQESNALVFFRELWHTIEFKQMTPDQLFREFDADNNGELSLDELTNQIRQILRFLPFPSAALTIQGPFDMFDLNGDGVISLEEFTTVMGKVRQAREMRKLNDEEKHPIFLSAKASPAGGSSRYRRHVFGHRAFVGCLVKIAFEHLGYHGSPAQAEQPSFAKALWLLLYLHWRFECCQERVLKQAKCLGRSHSMELPPGGRMPFYLSPLKKLVRHHPELFAEAPANAPPSELAPAWAPRRDPCSACSASAARGWGSPTCLTCSQADAIVAACWSRGRPSGRGQRSLDSMLLAVETGS